MGPTYEQMESVLANQASILAGQIALQAWLDWFKAALPSLMCGLAFVVTVMLSAFWGITKAFGRRGL